MPDSVTVIGPSAFQSCFALTEITLPEGLTSIGQSAFAWCTGLRSIVIPAGAGIGGSAFYGCTGLTSVYFEGNASGQTSRPPFSGCTAAIIYYRPGTLYWRPEVDERPTLRRIDPPLYGEWLPSTGLLTQFPNASAEAYDPDGDGMSNYAEMVAGTDPTDFDSGLTLEQIPRPDDLTEHDRAPLEPWQRALYFRSVPGKRYGIQWTDALGVPWRTDQVVSASTTQRRVIVDPPDADRFYRVILAQ